MSVGERLNHNDHRFSAVGVFIFSGGFAVGMAENFRVAAHLEDGPFGVPTFQANFPGVPVYTDPATWPLEVAAGADVLYGNPPCASFSPIGKSMRHGKESWRTDPNTQCTIRYLDLGLKAQPPIWVDESVPQIQRTSLVDAMAAEWISRGYAFTLVRQDAKFMGLPQQRRRCFMVAHRVEIPWQKPEYNGRQDIATAGEALETIPHVGWYARYSEEHEELMGQLRPGQCLRELWVKKYPEIGDAKTIDGKRVKGRPQFMVHRLGLDTPSTTIIGIPVYVHPTQPRAISPWEAARLCGYPDDFEWVGERDLYAQVAKAVTPPAARWLSSNLRRGLELAKPAEPTYRRVTAWGIKNRIECYEPVWQQEVLPTPERQSSYT